DRCIWAFPMDEWERLEERLRQPPHLSPDMRHIRRMLGGNAKDCAVDRVGRTLGPPGLRESAGLGRQVTPPRNPENFRIRYPRRERGRLEYGAPRALRGCRGASPGRPGRGDEKGPRARAGHMNGQAAGERDGGDARAELERVPRRVMLDQVLPWLAPVPAGTW